MNIKNKNWMLLLAISLFLFACNSTEKEIEKPEIATKEVEEKLSPAQQEVLDAVLRLHDGMRNKDGDLAASAWAETATGYNINIDSLGNVKKDLDPAVDIESMRNWLNTTTNDLEEEIFDVEVFIDGDLAMAWVPYNFYWDKKFSHSGSNAFTLVKIDGIWKIISVTDTRYFDKTKEVKK